MRVLSLILFLSLCTGSVADAVASELKVRVRLQRAASEVLVSGLDLKILAKAQLPSPLPGVTKARITHANGLWRVRLNGEKRAHVFRADRLKVQSTLLRLGLKPISFPLELVAGKKSGVDVIVRMGLERYLLGVLPAEMPAHWPLEALKAQTVAARSFALANLKERRYRDFDLDSTVMDQVFSFDHDSLSKPELREKIQRAVRETKGEVLRDSHRQILRAFYSADCGCRSEDPRDVWGGFVRDMISVSDPTCDSRPLNVWRVTIPEGEMRTRLLKGLQVSPKFAINGLNIHSRTGSGRVRDVTIRLEREGKIETRKITAQSFRGIFGYDRVRSTAFSLRLNSEGLMVEGSGSGHGVGLCQTGAKTLAEDGKGYREILELYYPQATSSAWDSSYGT